MSNFYNLSETEIFEELKSSKSGLSQKVAEDRLSKYGENAIKEKNKKSALSIFFGQFKNMMVLLLILVGIVSLVFSIMNHESLIEPIVIFSCILVNVFMGFFQELKSENVIDSLKTMTSSQTMTKRDGKWVMIDAKKLVIGDIIMLQAGDKVPADARILKAISAKVDESILTGESLTVKKTNDVLEGNKIIQEQSNVIFSGTNVVSGKIEAIVFKTAMETELGKIAGNLDSAEDALTPLQVKVKKVSGFITVIASILVAITFCYGLIMKKDALAIIMLCISMVLAAVPEVLPISITATLTIGVKQMSKKKAIVKQLAAIETLGATQIICSDKTGTITTNQMTVVELFVNEKKFIDTKTNRPEFDMMQKIMACCNDNEIDPNNKGEFYGDQVEMALSKYLYNLNLSLDDYRKKYESFGEIPFDSSRKMMSSINKVDDKTLMLTKGSLSSLLSRAVGYYKNGKVFKLNKLIVNKFLSTEKAMSKKAYKVLAFAYKEIDKKKEYTEQDEQDLILVGLAGLIDPPKDGVKEAVKICKKAKIRPIMITGDSLDTALAVAIEIGMAKDDDDAVEGKAIDGLNDDELRSFVKKYTVFARVTPEHKVRIVRAFQASGKVVAMTGDGVNDAPALKLAHVGVGMGKSGTDVTKNVADIILMDDSFATIVTAVEEGRRIYSNVIKTIVYNLTSNFAEIILILLGMFMLKDLISPLHILYVDIIADTIPSIALAFEKNNKNAMQEKPNGLNRRVFTPFVIASTLLYAVIEAGASIAIFFVAEPMLGYEIAQTLTLLSIVINEFVYTYNCKDLKDFSFKKGLFKNKFMNIAILILLLIQLPVFLLPIGSVFGLAQITIAQFAIVVAVEIGVFLLIEVCKPLVKKLFKDE